MPAPQHSVTAAIRVISGSDPAWDHPTIDAEFEALSKQSPGATHPWVAYRRGETRFDLDAPAMIFGEERTAKSYLRPEAKPMIWHGRRLKLAEQVRLRDIGGDEAKLMAFRLGAIDVENAPDNVRIPEQVMGRAMSEQMADSIAEIVGVDTVLEVGDSIMKASAAPTSAEKKL